MRISSSALIRRGEQILIVKPTCRDGWLLPGGGVEPGESPLEACRREVREETGLDLPISRLVCLDFWKAGAETELNGRQFLQREDELIFVFDGDEITDAQISEIRLPADELREFALLDLEQALTQLAPFYAERLVHALRAIKSGVPIYLEAGRLIRS